MGRTVYYDTGQLNTEGCIIKDFILTACTLQKNKKGPMYYQSKLADINCKNSMIIPLEKVLSKNEV